jgi:hypothetical protein
LLVGLRYDRTQWDVQPYAARDLADVLRALLDLRYRAENVHVVSDVSRHEIGVDWDFNYVEWNASFPSESLRSKMFEVVAPARAHDTVLFYFSGHGVSEKQARLFATPRSAPTLWTTFLPVPPPELLPQSPPDGPYRALLVVDACANTGTGLLGGSAHSSARSDIYALYSSALGAKSCWDDQLGMSVFTHYLVRGLRDVRDPGGSVNVASLASYLLRAVPKHAPTPNCLGGDPFAPGETQYQTPEVSEAENFSLGEAR